MIQDSRKTNKYFHFWLIGGLVRIEKIKYLKFN